MKVGFNTNTVRLTKTPKIVTQAARTFMVGSALFIGSATAVKCAHKTNIAEVNSPIIKRAIDTMSSWAKSTLK